MLKRLLIAYVFIFSYAGAVLHSIVPHHHHDSHQEAKEHRHHDHHTNHLHSDEHQDSEDHKHNDSHSLYFLTHAANTDILVTHVSIDTSGKLKKGEKLVVIHAALHVFNIISLHQVFHPPSGNLATHSTAYLFRALRAPPISFC
jgi:Ni/Co efflux regulator RcnB